MSSDPRIQQVQELMAQIDAADLAEDAAFQADIDAKSVSITTLTAERDDAVAALVPITTERDALMVEKDTLLAERDALLAEKASTVVELRSILTQLESRVALLESV